METFAFISYSRKDKYVANWLHSKLEKYPYPESLVKIENQPNDKKYVRPIFIDTKDLSVDEHPFNEKIKEVLRDSRYLILICSKYSVVSKYVNAEVTYFLKTHNQDYSKIVPLFIDDVDNNIPPSIQNSPVMERHFPIYNTALSEKSEANIYCFYQIAAYILGIDFSYIYNRYEIYAEGKKKKYYFRIGGIILSLLIVIMSLFMLLKKQKELVRFEKNIFPRSVVVGYERNFLKPVISYMKEKDEDFRIFVLMPTNRNEINNHQYRINDTKFSIVKELGVDSLKFEKLSTSMKRGTIVTTICTSDNRYRNVFLDFASTTSSFLEVAEYKKTHIAYENTEIDDLVKDYTMTFIKESKEELKDDSVFVEFFTSKNDLILRLKDIEGL